MDTLSQPLTSQSQGYCSYSQQQQEVRCSSKVQTDADHQSVEEIIRYHTAFMSKSMSTNLCGLKYKHGTNGVRQWHKVDCLKLVYTIIWKFVEIL